ncbi:hypothetical protein PAXRUDRAFT_825315 [Paxillus rubicundulus Ve08.2h10]|uniref:Uncharacterized protein n=1 Tax=Paxillus rubicundulus Ve08.2h10 TaxID=930991 RepID=A0A0D0DGI9_9AGAM|nr:hypothetical protein PAXRUDRAFT_825315 [Paxillus rubicundulus Ve08.2h10]
MFMQVILFLTSLVTFVYAVPLTLRDVVNPPITSPTATTVWHVGDTQIVTWNTVGLPSNPTNPNGMLVLGYMFNNSENLMLDSPLATNLSYATGQAEITVPNVPTGSNYIVVLFGDSGNASPEFTITNDASSSAAPTSASPTTTTPSSSPSAPAGPSPSGNSSALPTTTTSSSPLSTVVTATTSITPSPTQTGAAWQKRASGAGTSVGVVLTLLYFVF